MFWLCNQHFQAKFESLSFVIIFCSFVCSFFNILFKLPSSKLYTPCALHFNYYAPCTKHPVPVHLTMMKMLFKWTWGTYVLLLPPLSKLILQYVFLFVYFDMNAMYCILKGFSLYNFGNKIVFIVIVIVIVSNDTRVLVYKWNHLEYYFGIEYRYSTNVTWSFLNISLIKFLKIQVETIYLCKKTSGIPSGFIKTASTQLLNTLFLRTEFFYLQI